MGRGVWALGVAGLLLTLGANVRGVPQTPAAANPAQRAVLPFVDDDYSKALSEARRRNVPLFAELWAPW